MIYKKCSKCNKDKGINEFSPSNTSGIDGLNSWCKVCMRERAMLHRRTKSGHITKIYGNQRLSSRIRGHVMPEYTNKQLLEWSMSQPEFSQPV